MKTFKWYCLVVLSTTPCAAVAWGQSQHTHLDAAPATETTWPSVTNLRDVGGYPTRDGKWVRRGMVYRSAHFAYTTAADGAALTEALGLRTYFDLRSDREVNAVGGAEALVHAGVMWRRLPVDNSSDPLFQAQQRPAALWAGFYQRTLACCGHRFVQLLREIAASDAPVVYSCSLGKDRTGMATAMLLDLLGVDDETIVADYAASTANLVRREELFEPVFRSRSESREEFINNDLTAHPQAMRLFLAAVRAEHGSIRAALGIAGLTDADVQALQARLLRTTPAL